MKDPALRPVTLHDIAEATGYTINTVSRALKDKDDISRETRAYIQQVARKMGYVRNYLASSLRSGRTRTLAMIIGSMINPFYAILTDLIQRDSLCPAQPVSGGYTGRLRLLQRRGRRLSGSPASDR